MNIVAITPKTPAEAMGIQAGDQLLHINGHKISDSIDYEFYAADEELDILISRQGQAHHIQVFKGLDEELGIVVQPMKIRSCANNCIFCFAHQNPPGVREALNFKDGDYRFSFLHGHYITMTNMGRRQLDRVVEQHLSPLYISVHVTDPVLRKKMLLFDKDDYLLDKLKFLTEHNIELHTQIVLCPGWNDGDTLLQTIHDLQQFAPQIRSISIVPVGLTKYRDQLAQLRSYNRESAREFIRWFTSQQGFKEGHQAEQVVLLSDEFFILADEPIPDDSYYGAFSMIENGVGQCRDFANRFNAGKALLPERLKRPTRLIFPTGTLGFPFLKQTISPTLDQIDHLDYELLPVRNDWLGADLVTVTGLLSARDVVQQVKQVKSGDAVYLSYRMFSEDGITLDDHTWEDIEKKLGIPVYIHHEDILEILEPWA